MTNKDFCLSSYIAFRYIWRADMEFADGLHHKLIQLIPDEERIPVASANDIDREIQKQFDSLYELFPNIGILLSGGMDSAILASYLHEGSHAYTFTANGTAVFDADQERAAQYCRKFGLKHHLVDISFDDYKAITPIVMKTKCAPVHSIEPQIYKAAQMAIADGVDLIIVGESSDLIFGGMDKLLAKDWRFDEFVKRYTFLEPELVLKNPVSQLALFEQYRQGEYIDFMRFMDEVFSVESSSSYLNAFGTANLPYYDPYARLIMRDELDLNRVRNGEPKYLIRNLYAMKYPENQIPDKIPMPRPVDFIFSDWEGPKRPEFRQDIPMQNLTGNQKWQLWCAEQFLQTYC
ncbi:MAG: asparagine synthase C-terminal domain-containing protein [Bacteroidaceae bacterium]|nr:asparagine synthase C-terminal domain-containing protein [Bacteroidaceae bacterium]